MLDGGHSGASGGSTGEMGPQWSGFLRPGPPRLLPLVLPWRLEMLQKALTAEATDRKG